MTKYETIYNLIEKYDEDIKSLRLKWKYNIISTLEYLTEEDELDKVLREKYKEINYDKKWD